MNVGSRIFYCLLIGLLIISGCTTDMKEIQNLNYATAIGVDYKEGEYHLFIQLINLASVASTEGQESPPLTYVSDVTGPTFIEAFFRVYESGQNRFIWSHMTTILLSESALEEGIENIFDGLTRYYEFRLTPWVFGTNEPLDEMLTTLGFFERTSLETVLHNPQRLFEQSSLVRPIKVNQFGREIFEPAQTTYIPSLTINKDHWQKGQEDEPKLALNGAFFIQNLKYKGFFNLDQLKGLRWVAPETMRASLLVASKENAEFLVVMDHIDTEVILQEHQDTYQFQVVMKGEGSIGNELAGLTKLREMEQETNESIAKQIQELYQLGVEENIDFLNLEHLVYKTRKEEWTKLKNDDFLHDQLLDDIVVDVTLLHSGAFKNKQVQVDE
ncbi:Ger(x)C family spore germination protein [Alkalihalobacterium chitinilyticum]|uniref:Ger(X)C family spore germination protein n=1 Tax=Alkalihalobacterium chitinilyticum TaxID=2980103 RepID=A0ABT5VI08_9BACI|nr:Ger(x)C family spore germination protein [Alkalihalobacterium chitinilyticum]MDE5415085.1 Ger(x)C family spore germination protein [Alkalihalobacterium chitinilyticum]